MATEVLMPQMGYDMTEGRIAQWLKKPGEQVKRGEPIAEIETDKVTIEVEAFADGVLREQVAKEGDTVAVGKVIAIIAGADEPIPDVGADAEPTAEVPEGADAQPDRSRQETQEDPRTASRQKQTRGVSNRAASKDELKDGALAALRSRGQKSGDGNGRQQQAAPQPEQQAAPQPEQQAAPQPAPSRNGERIIATPAARSFAREHGVDLAQLSGSGPDGRIVLQDVKQAEAAGVSAPAQPEAKAPEAAPTAAPAPQPAQAEAAERRPLSRMRRVIARRMTESKQQAPHFYVTSAIQMDEVLSMRKRLNEGLSKEESVSVTDLIIKAAALALLKFPDLNASYGGEEILLHQQVNVSVAVAIDEGLLAPVVRDCANRSIGAISRDLKGAVERARTGKTRPEELEGGTFTVSNLGMYDVESFVAIITPPQSAILAIGSTKQEPVVRDGELAVAQIMRATISVDHRVSDGAYAARYLQEFKALLENPMRLML